MRREIWNPYIKRLSCVGGAGGGCWGGATGCKLDHPPSPRTPTPLSTPPPSPEISFAINTTGMLLQNLLIGSEVRDPRHIKRRVVAPSSLSLLASAQDQVKARFYAQARVGRLWTKRTEEIHLSEEKRSPAVNRLVLLLSSCSKCESVCVEVEQLLRTRLGPHA